MRVLVLVTVVALTGCNAPKRIGELTAEISKVRGELHEWQKKVDDFNDQWDKFGGQMITAADTLDPLALKELFRKNEELQTVNARLAAAISAADALDREYYWLSVDAIHWENLEVRPGVEVVAWFDANKDVPVFKGTSPFQGNGTPGRVALTTRRFKEHQLEPGVHNLNVEITPPHDGHVRVTCGLREVLKTGGERVVDGTQQAEVWPSHSDGAPRQMHPIPFLVPNLVPDV